MTQYVSGQIISDQVINSGNNQVDSTIYTGTPVALTQFCNLWDIGPGIASAGSAWRLTILGKSLMGGTQVGEYWYIGYGPNAATQVEIVQSSAVNHPINQTWIFTVVIHLIVTSGGAGGRATVVGTMAAGENPNATALTWTNGQSNLAFNTTADNKLCLLLTYTAATGTPLFTTYCSVFDRMS